MSNYSIDEQIRNMIEEVVSSSDIVDRVISDIDYQDMASEVVNHIKLDDVLLESTIVECIERIGITDLVDVDIIVDDIVRNHFDDIEEAIDIDAVAEKVMDSLDYASLSRDIVDEIESDVTQIALDGLSVFLSEFDPNSDSELTKKFIKAVNSIVGQTKVEEVVEDKNFIVGPFNGLEDETVVNKTVSLTKEDLDEVIASAISSISILSMGKDINDIPVDEIYAKVVSSLTGEVYSFITEK